MNSDGETRSGLSPASAADFCRWAADVRRWQWCQVVRAGVLVGEVVSGSTGRRSWWAEFPSDQHLPPTPPPLSHGRRAGDVAFDTLTGDASGDSRMRSGGRQSLPTVMKA